MVPKADLHRENGYEEEAGRDVRSEILLRTGVGAAIVFVGVLVIEGAVRPGYDPIYHTGSELSLGDRGWVQRANFLQMGLAMFAFALGVSRTLGDRVGAFLLAVFGLGLVISGVFIPDPIRGYPLGSLVQSPAVLSWQHQVHNIAGPIMFFALLGACLSLSRRLSGRWRLYTLLTAIAGLWLTVWTAAAWQSDAANTGLVQRGLILVYWSWIALLGMYLVNRSPRRKTAIAREQRG